MYYIWKTSIFCCYVFYFEKTGSIERVSLCPNSEYKERNWWRTTQEPKKEWERPSSQMSCSTNVKIEPMNMWKAYMPSKAPCFSPSYYFFFDIFLFLYIEYSFLCLYYARWKFIFFHVHVATLNTLNLSIFIWFVLYTTRP